MHIDLAWNLDQIIRLLWVGVGSQIKSKEYGLATSDAPTMVADE